MKRNERENKKNKENAVRLMVHGITHRGEMWGGGEVRRQREGGGGRLLFANLYMSRVKWYDNTYTFQLLLKGTFTYSDSNPRDSRNQEM